MLEGDVESGRARKIVESEADFLSGELFMHRSRFTISISGIPCTGENVCPNTDLGPFQQRNSNNLFCLLSFVVGNPQACQLGRGSDEPKRADFPATRSCTPAIGTGEEANGTLLSGTGERGKR